MRIKKMIKNFSLLPQGLRYKLLIAFSLMSIIPLLVVGYLVNSYIFLDEPASLGQVSTILLFCIIITWLGLFLAKTIIERVVDIALETKIITNGNYDRKIEIVEGDEIGQIGEAINFLTQKIKSNIGDLKDYQGKMKEINSEIQKKVSVISNILQIGELISSSVKIDAILELIMTKLSSAYENGFAAIYFASKGEPKLSLRVSSDLSSGKLLTMTVKMGEGFLGKVLQKRKYAVMDSSTKPSSDERAFREEYKCENLIAFPVTALKGARALLVVGSKAENLTFTNEDVDVIKIFAEQIAIAIENDMLIQKANKLEINDEPTGLFNRTYIVGRLKEEIQRSAVSQRPCSFAMVSVDGFKDYESKKGKSQAEIALRKIAGLVNDLSGSLSKAGRIEDDTFGIILAEVNKKSSLEIVEKIRKAVEKLKLSNEKEDTLTVSCGVSENPLDGSTSEEILKKAEIALSKAQSDGKNKVIGAEV